MRVVFESGALKAAAKHAKSIVKKSTDAIYECVRVAASPDGSVEIASTDLDLFLRERLRAKVDSGGVFAVNATRFCAVVGEAAGGEVELRLDGDDLVVGLGEGESYRIRTADAEKFPRMLDDTGDATWTLSALEFAYVVERACFATIGAGHKSYALNGVCFEHEKKQLSVVGSDGSRLSWCRIPMRRGKAASCLIPPAALTKAAAIFSGRDEDVDLSVTDRHACIRSGGAAIVTRIIDGRYFKVEAAFPEPSPKELKVQREDLSEALRKVLLLTAADAFTVRCRVQRDRITITTRADHVGRAEVEIEAKTKGDARASFGFDPAKLRDAIQRMDAGAEVTIRYGSTHDDPLFVSDSEHYTFILACVQVQ